MANNNDFVLLPPGTIIAEPDDFGCVMITFPTIDDSVVFFEFLRAFVSGEIQLEAVSK